MRVMSFNANGIRSAARKGFFAWFHQQNVDFLCIQETKVQREQLENDPLFFPEGYTCEYVDAVKKGYSGVAIYARQKPISVTKSLGFDTADNEGRYLRFDYENLSVISLYMPSGTTGDIRQTVKYDFLDKFETHLRELKALGRECIICGDYNIVHKEIDIKNWRANQKNSGCLPEERAWLDNVFGTLGFVDAFRINNQKPEQYTWWSNRGQARANNVGWRLDYQVITPGLADGIVEAHIHREPFFSDHAPLMIDYGEVKHA